MVKNTKKVIIFDFWGTLVDNGVYSPFKQIKEILGLQEMDYSEFVVRFEKAMMIQRFSELKEAFERVCAEFEVPPEGALIANLVGLWNKNWLLAKPYPETVEVLAELKKNHKMVLISNTDCFSVEKVLEKFQLLPFFDLVLFSYNEGMTKTDLRFYEKIFSSLNVMPQDCIAVGDSIETDVISAQQAEVDVVLLDRRQRREFPLKITTLRELIDDGARFFGHERHAAD